MIRRLLALIFGREMVFGADALDSVLAQERELTA